MTEGEEERQARARTFESLRRRDDMVADKEREQLAAAWQVIASTPQGQFVLDWLHRITDGVVLGADAPDGALRMHEGKRQLVHAIDKLRAYGGRKPE